LGCRYFCCQYTSLFQKMVNIYSDSIFHKFSWSNPNVKHQQHMTGYYNHKHHILLVLCQRETICFIIKVTVLYTMLLSYVSSYLYCVLFYASRCGLVECFCERSNITLNINNFANLIFMEMSQMFCSWIFSFKFEWSQMLLL